MNKLTPWFATDVKPVRDGVYNTELRTNHGSLFGYSFWRNGCWSDTEQSVAEAYACKQDGEQDKLWRGLTKEAA